jgi:hypothetical protein
MAKKCNDALAHVSKNRHDQATVAGEQRQDKVKTHDSGDARLAWAQIS